jgi:NAD(P)-dependent dehydrogenase (short-subunit alcohol dehydrogenase family)
MPQHSAETNLRPFRVFGLVWRCTSCSVPATLRRGERSSEAAGRGLEVTSEQLDVADSQSVEDCFRRLVDTGTEIDVLVNNAGVYPMEGVFSMSEETLVMALEVNTVGPFRTCRALVPGMTQRGYGRVVNVSSGGGSFGEGLGPAAYALSKAALNALTVKVSQAVHGDVKVNAMCPGWVRSDMGGSGAPRSPEEAANTLVWLATLPADGPNGGFFRDREPILW